MFFRPRSLQRPQAPVSTLLQTSAHAKELLPKSCMGSAPKNGTDPVRDEGRRTAQNLRIPGEQRAPRGPDAAQNHSRVVVTATQPAARIPRSHVRALSAMASPPLQATKHHDHDRRRLAFLLSPLLLFRLPLRPVRAVNKQDVTGSFFTGTLGRAHRQRHPPLLRARSWLLPEARAVPRRSFNRNALSSMPSVVKPDSR
ncbi:hypothetical protein MRX96_016689 [Rhipicephalus microplus]